MGECVCVGAGQGSSLCDAAITSGERSAAQRPAPMPRVVDAAAVAAQQHAGAARPRLPPAGPPSRPATHPNAPMRAHTHCNQHSSQPCPPCPPCPPPPPHRLVEFLISAVLHVTSIVLLGPQAVDAEHVAAVWWGRQGDRGTAGMGGGGEGFGWGGAGGSGQKAMAGGTSSGRQHHSQCRVLAGLGLTKCGAPLPASRGRQASQ